MLHEIQEGNTPVAETRYYNSDEIQTVKALAVPEQAENAVSIEYKVDSEETDTVEFDGNSRDIGVSITINWIDGTETYIILLIIYKYTGT